jgi:putative PEP-CTERM system histidine kinase
MPLEIKLFTGAYGLAAIGFLLLAGLLVVRPIRSRTGRMFLVATLVSCLTYGLTALTFWFPKLVSLRAIASLPLVAWSAFLLVCVAPMTGVRIVRVLGFAVAFFWILDVLIQHRLIPVGTEMRFLIRVAIAILTLVCAEQLIRSSDSALRWATKHIVLALAVCATFDLVFYAYGLVQGKLEPSMAVLRGFVWVMACPLLAVSAARNPSWDVGIHVSRRLVFHSLTILLVGGFLVSLGALGYIVTNLGIEWGAVMQGIVIVAGLSVGATALISHTFRSRVRAFVDRNFYNYRFDYREEWLRFTSALSSRAGEPVYEVVCKAFQSLADAPGSAMYLRRNNGRFQIEHQYGISGLAADFDGSVLSHAGFDMPRDLSLAGAEIPGLLLPPATSGGSGSPPRFVIPLIEQGEPFALVVLTATRSGMALDREVSDLLGVAARQAATYVSQALATEELVIARQFESFNKMSAFVVHDLKNLAAQLALLTANAERHKDNPEFQRDMIETVQHVTNRMRLLLEQLSKGTSAVDPPAVVEIYQCIEHALRQKPSLGTKPKIDRHSDEPVYTLAHEDRLARIIGHLVQNADESIKSQPGEIAIRVEDASERVLVAVTDNGSGMSDSFVRDRLFKPFSSTKETGMGIGVFESANYLKEIGGVLRVASALGRGTTFTIELPRAQLT